MVTWNNKAETLVLDSNEYLSKSRRARYDITPKIGSCEKGVSTKVGTNKMFEVG
jgi:hypothetical protein